MTGYLLRRVVQFVPVIILASLAVWALIYAAPGSPADAYAGENATPEQIAAVERDLGLDRPLYVQYVTWLGRVATGDLGESAVSGANVADQLFGRIPATLYLGAAAMVGGLLIAIPLGIIAALRPRSWMARVVNSYQAAGLAVPTFWSGLLLTLLVGVKLRLLPVPAQYIPLWTDPVESLRNIALPALTIAVLIGAIVSRFLAASLTEVLDQDYIRLARSKGAPERSVVMRHGVRNALLPTVTVVGLQLGALFGGAVVTEVVFNYPGLGRLLYNAVLSRDYPMVQGTVIFIVVVFLVLNLAVDVLYARLDPRVRLN